MRIFCIILATVCSLFLWGAFFYFTSRWFFSPQVLSYCNAVGFGILLIGVRAMFKKIEEDTRTTRSIVLNVLFIPIYLLLLSGSVFGILNAVG